MHFYVIEDLHEGEVSSFNDLLFTICLMPM